MKKYGETKETMFFAQCKEPKISKLESSTDDEDSMISVIDSYKINNPNEKPSKNKKIYKRIIGAIIHTIRAKKRIPKYIFRKYDLC
jgi:hypothetical protein